MYWVCLLLLQLVLDSVLCLQFDLQWLLVLLQGLVQCCVLCVVSLLVCVVGLCLGMLLLVVQVLVQDMYLYDYDFNVEQYIWYLLVSWVYVYSLQVSFDFLYVLVLEIGVSCVLFGDWLMIQQCLCNELYEFGFCYCLVVVFILYVVCVLVNVYDGFGFDVQQLLVVLVQLFLVCCGLFSEVVMVFGCFGLCMLGVVFKLLCDSLVWCFVFEVLQQLDVLCGLFIVLLCYYQLLDCFDVCIEFEYEIEFSQVLLFLLCCFLFDLVVFLCLCDGGVQCFDLYFEYDLLLVSVLIIGLLVFECDFMLLFEIVCNCMEVFVLLVGSCVLCLQVEQLLLFVFVVCDLFDICLVQVMLWNQLCECLCVWFGDDVVQLLVVQVDYCFECVSGIQLVVRLLVYWLLCFGWLLDVLQLLCDLCLCIIVGLEWIELGWWDQVDVCCDYYVVEIVYGQCGWVFCVCNDLYVLWMLYGWFG